MGCSSGKDAPASKAEHKASIGGKQTKHSVVENISDLLHHHHRRPSVTLPSLTSLLHVAPLHKHKVVTSRSLNKDYNALDDVLGVGLSGDVVRAVHRKNGTCVAIKKYRKHGLKEDVFEQLANEVSICLTLDHPNVCKLFAVYDFPPDAEVHMVLEHCGGRELYHALAEHGRFAEDDSIKVCKAMLSALHYCHLHHVVHRDVKLENWLFETPDRDPLNLKLIDFGFATTLKPTDAPLSTILGTMYYCAPEVLERCYGHKADVWSAGVICYMLLSGAPPFLAPKPEDLAEAVRTQPLAFLGPRWDGVSDEAMDFIRSLVNRDVTKRLNADEALKHKWLRVRGIKRHSKLALPPQQPGADSEELAPLLEFACQSDLRRACFGVLAGSAMAPNEQQQNKVREAFRKLNTNDTGTITYDAFMQLAQATFGMSKRRAERVFKLLDLHGNGAIHYSEFSAALQSVTLAQDEEAIRSVFETFDTDKSGYISLSNLRDIFGDGFGLSSVEDMLAQGADYFDERGLLACDGFVAMVRDTRRFRICPSDMSDMNSNAEARDRNTIFDIPCSGPLNSAPFLNSGSLPGSQPSGPLHSTSGPMDSTSGRFGASPCALRSPPPELVLRSPPPELVRAQAEGDAPSSPTSPGKDGLLDLGGPNSGARHTVCL